MQPLDQYLDTLPIHDLRTKMQLIGHAERILSTCIAEELKAHCHVLNVADRTMTIAADSATWLTWVRYAGDIILHSMQQHPNLQHVQHIHWRIMAPTEQTQPHPAAIALAQKKKASKHSKVIADDHLHQLHDAATSITDPQLKKALERFIEHQKRAKALDKSST